MRAAASLITYRGISEVVTFGVLLNENRCMIGDKHKIMGEVGGGDTDERGRGRRWAQGVSNQ